MKGFLAALASKTSEIASKVRTGIEGEAPRVLEAVRSLPDASSVLSSVKSLEEDAARALGRVASSLKGDVLGTHEKDDIAPWEDLPTEDRHLAQEVREQILALTKVFGIDWCDAMLMLIGADEEEFSQRSAVWR